MKCEGFYYYFLSFFFCILAVFPEPCPKFLSVGSETDTSIKFENFLKMIIH